MRNWILIIQVSPETAVARRGDKKPSGGLGKPEKIGILLLNKMNWSLWSGLKTRTCCVNIGTNHINEILAFTVIGL